MNLLYRTSEGAPFRLVLPALVSTAILTALISPTPRADFTSSRNAGRDLAIAGVLAIASMVSAETIPLVLNDADAPGTFTRNLLGFLGIGLIVRVVIPASLAPLLPLAWMIPTLTLAPPEGTLIAWPLLIDASDPRGIVAAATLLAVGLTTEYTRTRRAPQRAH
ncbi:hypothetical protein [Actinotalea subterranea]|uniref:hypothetical protein n=1 Tax=Actinotalea subterranea TaxID=2607497 RepID=UPI0011ECBC9F|nr:hypothetical protein [Actinotalea subterranea]